MNRLLRVLALLPLLGLAACTSDGLYRDTGRLAITAPPDRAEVELPVRIAWRADPGADGYVVVVDRVPMPPGETPAWFGSDRAGVIRTSATEVFLDRSVAATGGGAARHAVTVVAVDDRGRRIDETSAHVTFRTAPDGER